MTVKELIERLEELDPKANVEALLDGTVIGQVHWAEGDEDGVYIEVESG